jgi:hypothetical protein
VRLRLRSRVVFVTGLCLLLGAVVAILVGGVREWERLETAGSFALVASLFIAAANLEPTRRGQGEGRRQLR